MSDDNKTIIIRIAEWTQWIPAAIDDKVEPPSLALSAGQTGCKALASEKLINVEAQDTGLSQRIEVGANGKQQLHKLYAFQATFAREVSAANAVPRGPEATVRISQVQVPQSGSPIIPPPGMGR